jgi:hypothetical protein
MDTDYELQEDTFQVFMKTEGSDFVLQGLSVDYVTLPDRLLNEFMQKYTTYLRVTSRSLVVAESWISSLAGRCSRIKRTLSSTWITTS